MAVSVERALGSDHQIARNLGDGDGTVFINAGCHILAAHGDGDGQTVAADSFRKGGPCGNAFIIVFGCCGTGEFVGNGINRLRSGLYRQGQQLIQHCLGDMIHALGVGVNVVRKHIEGHAALPQIHNGNPVMVTDGLQNGGVFVQLCAGNIAGHGVGGHCHDLGVGVEVLQAHDGCNIGVSQSAPLFGGQIHLCRCGSGVEASQRYTSAHIVAGTKEQDQIRAAVGTQILDTGQRCHGRIGAQVAGVGILGVEYLGACPAFVDAQFRIQLLYYLHPPGFVHISQQITLGVSSTVLQIEAVRRGNITGKGGGAGTEDGNDFTLVGSQAIGSSTANRALTAFVGMRCVEDVQLVIIAIAPHGNVDRSGTLGGNEISAVLAELGVSTRRIQGFDDTVFAKEGHADAIGGSMTVFPCFTEGGSKNLVTRLDGNGHGGHIPATVNLPGLAAGKIHGVMLQQRPQVRACAIAGGHLGQMIPVQLAGVFLRNGHAALGTNRSQCSGCAVAGGQVIVIVMQPIGERIGHIFTPGYRTNHRNDQRAALRSGNALDFLNFLITCPVNELDGSLFRVIRFFSQQNQCVAHGFPAQFIIADLVIVNGVVNGLGSRGFIPAVLLLHLGGVIHGSVGVVLVKIFADTVGSVGHPDPILTDGANQMNIGQFGIVAHPILRHPGAAHAQIHKGLMIGIRILIAVHAVTVTGSSTAHTDRNNAAHFKGLGSGSRIRVMIKCQFGLEAFVHGQILLYIPLSALGSVRTALAPEVGHVAEGKVTGSNFLTECFGASGKQGLALLIFRCSGLPGANGGTAVGRIHDPDLFARLLHPFIGETAVGADFTLSGFCQRINRIAAQAVLGARHVDAAVGARQSTGSETLCVGCGHSSVIRATVITVSGIDHTFRANNGLVRVTLTAAHIALACQKQQRNGRRGDGDLMQSAVYGDHSSADARSNELVAAEGHNSGVTDRVFLDAVAHLIRGRRARVDDLHSSAADVVAVVILQSLLLHACFPNIDVFHRAVVQGEVGSAEMADDQVAARQIIACGAQRICARKGLVHGADLHIVHEQPNHIAAVGCHAVFQSVNMLRSAVDAVVAQCNAVLQMSAGGVFPKGQQPVFRALKQIGRGGTAGACGIAEQHTAAVGVAVPCAAALPLHRPRHIVQKCHRLCQSVLRLAEHAVDGSARPLGQLVFVPNAVGHAHQIGAVECPAIGRQRSPMDGDGVVSPRDGHSACGDDGIRQQVVVVITEPAAKGDLHFLGAVNGAAYGHDQGLAFTDHACGHICHPGNAVPGIQLDAEILHGCFHTLQSICKVLGSIQAHLVIADLLKVDGVMNVGRLGGCVPSGCLCSLNGVIHAAVGIAFRKIFRNAVAAVGHGDPFVTHPPNQQDVLQLGIAAQPELGHTGAGHLHIHIIGVIIAFRFGGVGPRTVLGLVAAARANGDDGTKLQRQLGGFAVPVVVNGDGRLESLVHGDIIPCILLGGAGGVRTALIPEIAELLQGVVPCGDFLFQRGLHRCVCGNGLVVISLIGQPGTDGGAAVGHIDGPHLVPCHLVPAVGNGAVHADLAVTRLCGGVDGIGGQIICAARCVDGAVLSRKGGGDVVGCGFHSQLGVSCVGGIGLTIRNGDGLALVAVGAVHIALTHQQEHRQRCRGDLNFAQYSVDLYLCCADAGGDQLVAGESHNGGILYGVFRHAVAHLIRSGLTRIHDLHGLSADIIAVIVAQRNTTGFTFRFSSVNMQLHGRQDSHQQGQDQDPGY